MSAREALLRISETNPLMYERVLELRRRYPSLINLSPAVSELIAAKACRLLIKSGDVHEKMDLDNFLIYDPNERAD